MSRSLKNIKISDSYPRLVQQIDGIFYDGAGNIIPGISGPQGHQGFRGPQGFQGNQGFRGPQGNNFAGYDNEIHVSQLDGNDTTGNGDLLTPVASVTRALELINSERRTIIVHPGTYTENPSVTYQYTNITTSSPSPGNVVIVGTLSANNGCTITGLRVQHMDIDTPTGQGDVNILTCEIYGQFTKTSNADHVLLRFCAVNDLHITGAGGLVAVFGGSPDFITVSNAGARLLVKNAVTFSPILTAGSASFADCIILASGATSEAITTSAGSIITLTNSQILVPTYTNVARVSLGGIYSILNCVYDRPNSNLSAYGTASVGGNSVQISGSTNSIDYFQYINADKFITQGGTSSQFVKGDGSLDSNAYQRLLVNPIGGTGTSNYLPKFIGASAIGNSSIQDSGSLVTITNPLTIFGTTASDTAPLGSELAGVTVTATNWVLAIGATNLNFGGYAHLPGSTIPLTTSIPASIGTYYQLVYTVTNRSSGTATIDYGGNTVSGINANGIGIIGPIATASTALIITPNTSFNGTVAISLKPIGIRSATSTFCASNGTNNIEVRSSDIITNTFVGLDSGRRNTTGDNNTSIGKDSLRNNTTGTNNAAIGSNTLEFNATGSNNTAIGKSSLLLNVNGNFNTSTGKDALSTNSSGSLNTVNGYQALRFNSTGNDNTASGQRSLYSNTFGSGNVATGSQSLYSNTTGNDNTAYGFNALYTNISGTQNVAIGASALGGCTGSNNIAIGWNSGSDAVATIGASSNQIVIGNNSSTNAYIKVAWTVTSDARDKTNFMELPHGLNFVKELNPIQFQYRESRESENVAGDVKYGFKAQEILSLEGEFPVIIDNKDPGNLKYTESNLIPVLVKAIQEQQTQIDELKQLVNTLIK